MPCYEHMGKRPTVHPTATVAPTATLVGDVSVGPDTRVLFGAVLTAESGPITIGESCVIMENAVLRGVARHPLTIEDHVLVGPHAHLSGCRVEREVFIATGATIFNGAVLETRSVVKINGIVHVRSRLRAREALPINWIAVGDPAEMHPPEARERVTELMNERNFKGTVFGLEGSHVMEELTRRYATHLGSYGAVHATE